MPQLTLAQAFGRAPKKSGTPEKPKQPNTSPNKHRPTQPAPAQSTGKILFGPNGPHSNFDQFAVHPINYNGVVYPSPQHLFQALKFVAHRMDIAETIRNAATAEIAFDIAHANKAAARADWFSINLEKMEEVLFLKFTQYDQLKQELLATGSDELYQDSATDTFWSVGPDLLGCNEFGKALERVRARLGGAPAPFHPAIPCLKCGKKPRYGESLYCGTTCLKADISRVPPTCPRCRRRPQIGNLGFCGTTCLSIAAQKR
uniref:NADAR domain-containing protein n=1 Tax=Mycena chlorophos TaxID=658473 RepID=A0ABQ0LXE7_MYCCL|nr:predicted protein [Mycena chlorophos]